MSKHHTGSVVQRQTIKQAKAAYKTRAQQSLTDADQKRLERSIELDRRAWRSKEQERKRVEAAKKRQEREHIESRTRQRQQIGSQRRCDRFGYKSSQFHLGKFFGGVAARQANQNGIAEEREDDDGGLDDESLLGALDSPEDVRQRPDVPQKQHLHYDTPMPLSFSPAPVNPVKRSQTEPPTVDELDGFWKELGSSTQIARELDSDHKVDVKQIKNASFDSGDFDLTAEDLEDLDSPQQTTASKAAPLMAQELRTVMPTPAVPFKLISQVTTKSSNPPPAGIAQQREDDRRLMPPPHMPLKTRTTSEKLLNNLITPSNPASFAATSFQSRNLKSSDCGGFTMGELESFVDDELVLTQVAPG
ncbi:hypothetical protein B0A50_06286 [Salinomyces thailandicus]|uniref:Uncharacterized protein n=1 Tax=Salinomyces thailandicus TaxID=706561 RepID=A0A4V5N4C2_9PEZI|nr:hypothetical protein B0A50_06286 [Salinomyces thailandica]